MTVAQPSSSTRFPRPFLNSASPQRPAAAKIQSGRLGVIPDHRRSCPFVFILLQTLGPRQKSQPLCNQANPASFQKTPGVWGPLPSPDLHESQVTSHKSRPPSCAKAQKCLSASPLPATLAHSLSRNSFPCHSYANTRDGGAPLPKLFSPPATRHSPLQFLNTFRINTCKSVSKQRTSSPFRINTYEKPRGEGGGVGLSQCQYKHPAGRGYHFIALSRNSPYTRDSWPD
jgi:hypothetical protein